MTELKEIITLLKETERWIKERLKKLKNGNALPKGKEKITKLIKK